MLEWVGGDFEPELFDLEETNAVLAEIDYDLAGEELF